MGILQRLRDLWALITQPPHMPEKEEFHAETQRRQDSTTIRLTKDQEKTEPEQRHAQPLRKIGVALLAAALCLPGCAALKAVGPMLLEYGIDRAEDLAAQGKGAIEDARKKAEAIPDAIDRNTALLEVMRAEQIYQTGLLEWIAEDMAGDDGEWFLIPVPAPSEGEAEPEPDA